MRNLLAVFFGLMGIAWMLQDYPPASEIARLAIGWFLPGIGGIFFVSFFLSRWFLKVIDQPPLMIYILSMVVKMLSSLTLFLVFILKHPEQSNKAAGTFLILYLIFEILEIKRFLSILRPDSRESTSG
jgi:hypothetical protein